MAGPKISISIRRGFSASGRTSLTSQMSCRHNPESLVKARARARIYEQSKAKKSPQNPRGAGADFRFLIGEANKTFTFELKQARLNDRDKVDIFVSTMRRFGNNWYYPATFNQATGAVSAQVGV